MSPTETARARALVVQARSLLTTAGVHPTPETLERLLLAALHVSQPEGPLRDIAQAVHAAIPAWRGNTEADLRACESRADEIVPLAEDLREALLTEIAARRVPPEGARRIVG